MRQLLLEIPRGCGAEALEIVRGTGGINLARLEAGDPDGPVDLVIAHVGNAEVGPLLEKLERLPNLRVTFAPQGVLALRPPAEGAPEQVKEVQHRSPIEIFLSGLQSVGSWKAFLGYALISGIVAWIGLLTETIYLLTAAMLIAPFAGPAMNAAIATARGDRVLLGRSLLRYFAALAVNVAAAAGLSLAYRLDIATPTMVAVSQVSAATALLPLAAGAAGALNLSQSERSSLVSGAATGMLVAAALAPPASLVGMALALRRFDMVGSGLFVLLLQVVGINLAGALVFRAYGLSPQGPRFQRGDSKVVVLSLAVTTLVLAALVTGQFSRAPALERSSRAQRAAAVVREAVDDSGLAHLVEANVRFTRAQVPGQETLLGVIYVQRAADLAGTPSDEELSRRLTRAIQGRLVSEGFQVEPLVDVNVLSAGHEAN
jgi:uncharacterized hydrophobic protein (TIGR00271 family)